MPRYRENWESDYHDPISDAEEAKQKAFEEELNRRIMIDIELCKQEEEDNELMEMQMREYQRELEEHLTPESNWE